MNLPKSSISLRLVLGYASCACLLALSTRAGAQVIDPEVHIQKTGYDSLKMGDDGVTRFYMFTERAAASRIATLEQVIAALPKQMIVFNVCDQMRGSVKAKLLQDRGLPFDVAAINYGYSGSTIACVLKYMHESKVGTQLIYMKRATGGMYIVFVTD